MDFSEEWKSLWPISSSHAPPLLLQASSSPSLGPLFFNPIPESLTLLLSSPSSLSPPFLPPPPHLSLSRFLETSTSHDSPILPSTASTISADFGPHHHHLIRRLDAVHFSRLEPLCWLNNRMLVFFPTGANLDRVGFLVLSVKDSNLVVDFSSDGSVFTSNQKFAHRIVQISACSVSDCPTRIGFLVTCTLYAVHWFAVNISGHGSDSEKPALVYLGTKLFKSCAVAHACWNPHLPGECVVLLESGQLFLFDMNSPCSNARFRGKRISVSWDEPSELAGGGWFSCEFSWHPRIMVVANSKAIYLVDCRFGKCQPSCLLTVEMLGMNDIAEKDQFVAFSKAGPDDFFYAVASEQWLLLCDVRKPLMPVLRWAHNLHEPCYLTVLPLSELRLHPRDEKYAGASGFGFGIILGSFWNNDFSLFCYGRPLQGDKQASCTKISNFSNSFYAWDLPSQLSLCGQDCLCSSCVLREEFAKDDLPEWIEWQQKRDLVLGFFILDKDLSSLLPRVGEHGGFTLVRLMSSGKLQMQQYCASWKMERIVAMTHDEMRLHLKDSLLCSMGDEKYKFPRRFKYLKLDYLYAHLNDNLAKKLFSKFRDAPAIASGKKCPNERFLKFMSEKLKSFGCDPPIAHLSASDIFRDVNMPTSLYEIVCRIMWIRLPMDILEVAFSQYTEVVGVIIDQKKVSLDFPVVPDKNQSPPFLLRNPSHRSNKWSSKEQPTDDFVGPVVPLPVSLVLSEISKYGISFIGKVNEFSPEEVFARDCKSVMCLAKEMAVFNSCDEDDKQYAVSLVDDKEETWVDSSKPSPFFLYEPSAISDELPHSVVVEGPTGFVEGERFNVMIAKLPENERVDKGTDNNVVNIFDDLCPVELKFDDGNQNFAGEELKAYELLTRQFSQWQDGFIPYQNLCARLKPQQRDVKSWRRLNWRMSLLIFHLTSCGRHVEIAAVLSYFAPETRFIDSLSKKKQL